MPDEQAGGTATEEAAQGAEGGEGTKETSSEQSGEGSAENKVETEVEVPTRQNTVKDFIIERKQKQIEKLREKQEQAGESDEDVSGLVAKEVQKILRPTLEVIGKTQDEQELKGFLDRPEHAHFKAYEKTARSYMATYKNVPVDFIFKGLDYANAMKRGAEAGTKAKDEATRSTFGGNNARAQQGAPIDAFDMAPDEFQAEVNRRMNR